MGKQITSIRQHISSIVRVLEKVSRTLSVGFVAYRDRGDTYITKSYPLTAMNLVGMKSLQNFLNRLEASKNLRNDWPEAVEEGLRVSQLMKWRQKAKKITIVIGDAASFKKNMARCYQLAKEIQSRDRSYLSAIYTGQFIRSESGSSVKSKAKRPIDEAFFKALAQAGGGEYIGGRGRILESVLLSIL